MSAKLRFAAQGFAVTVGLVWLLAIPATLLIDRLYDELVDRNRASYPAEFGEAPISMFIINPNYVLLAATGLTILLAVHWLIALPFSKNQLHKAPVANAMIGTAILLAALTIFESAAHDFASFSLFCGPADPPYFEFDITYECARSRAIYHWSTILVMLLPLLSIPVRIFESRRSKFTK